MLEQESSISRKIRDFFRDLGTKISRAVTNLATEDKLTINLYSSIANR